MTTSTLSPISAADVHDTLARHLFVDGFDVVFDYEKSFRVSFRINSTWGGGLTDMVRFGRFLEIIREEKLVDDARVIGDRLLEGLRGLEAGGTIAARGAGDS